MYSQYLNKYTLDIKRHYLEFVYSIMLNGKLLDHLDKITSFGIYNILFISYRFGIKLLLSIANWFTDEINKTNEKICKFNSVDEYFTELFDNCDYGNYRQYYDICKLSLNHDKFVEFCDMCKNDDLKNVFELYKNVILKNGEDNKKNIDEFNKFSAMCLTDITRMSVSKIFNSLFDANGKLNQMTMDKVNSTFVNNSNKYFENLEKLSEENFNDNFDDVIDDSSMKNFVTLFSTYYKPNFKTNKKDPNPDPDIDVEMGLRNNLFEQHINVNIHNTSKRSSEDIELDV